MSALKAWAIAMSGACILCAAVSYLRPHIRFEKVLKLTLSAFLITVLITPFCTKQNIDVASFFPDEETAHTQQTKAQDYLLSLQLNEAAQAVKKEIASFLTEKKYSFKEISLSMNIDENNNIFINEITISGVEERARQKVHDALKKNYNLEAAVI